MAAAARAAHLIVDDEPLIFRDTLAAVLLGERADEFIDYHRANGAHLVLAGARVAVTPAPATPRHGSPRPRLPASPRHGSRPRGYASRAPFAAFALSVGAGAAPSGRSAGMASAANRSMLA